MTRSFRDRSHFETEIHCGISRGRLGLLFDPFTSRSRGLAVCLEIAGGPHAEKDHEGREPV